jgi:hypothetical protein
MILSPALSSMIADTIQSLGNRSWIESSPLFTTTYAHVIPGPINLDQIQHKTNAFKTTFVNVKCSSNKFLEEPNNIEIEPEQKFYVNLAVYNQSKHTETLPVGVIADITPMTDEHQADFSKAASETASDMACEAVEQLEQVQLHKNLYRKAQHKQAKVCHDILPHPFQSFNPLHAQKR